MQISLNLKKDIKKKLLCNLKQIKKNHYHSIVIAVKHKEIQKLKLEKIKSYGVKV